jgi:hypothetical protein
MYSHTLIYVIKGAPRDGCKKYNERPPPSPLKRRRRKRRSFIGVLLVVNKVDTKFP